MKVRKLVARFGKLDNKTLELSGGMNIVAAPNESGKSTWCAFIRAMLYGIDTSQRAKAGVLPDKTLYSPWSGASPQGSMDLIYNGENITIRRETKSASAPMRTFSAVYTGTENAYPLTGTDAGEILTGASRDVFARSAFIGQSAVRVENSPELEKRIAAIVSTGEESGLSYTDADDKLKQWQRERYHNARVGANAELSTKLDELQAQLRSIQSLHQRREAVHAEVQVLEEKLLSLRRLVDAESAAQQEKLGKASEDLQMFSQQVHLAEETERAKRQALDGSRFGSKDEREVERELGEAKEKCKRLREQSDAKSSGNKLTIPIVLGVVAIILGISAVKMPLLIVPALALLALAIINAVKISKTSKQASEATAQLSSILRQYAAEDESDLDALLRRHGELYTQWQQAALLVQNARESLADKRSGQAYHSPADTQYEVQHRSAEQMLKTRREELAGLDGRSSVLGDAPEILAECARVRECMEENSRQLDAIALAREMLKKADNEQLSRFSPRLTHRAAQLFSSLTNSRYDELGLDRALNVSAKLTGDALGHESAYLSEGARALLYLSLRLAICELALPEDKNVPIIIDDALGTLDDERCKAVLDTLYELSLKRQIILFTCHSREGDYLKTRPGVKILEEM